MSLTTCIVRYSKQPGKTIILSSALAKTLQMSGVKTVTIRHGSKSISASIKRMKRNSNDIYLPTYIRQALKIPRPGSCLIQSVGNRELQLGPLIGLLTGVSGGSSQSPFGTRTELIRSYLRANPNRAFIFAFSPGDINWQNEQVYGYFVDGYGKWTRKSVPLPNAVYNRLPSRKADKSSRMENLKSNFERRGIPIFNWSFFDKMDVYRLLEGEEAYKYVPDSNMSPSASKIRDMVKKHRFVYLKPTAGSLGNGIYKLTYVPNRGYFARYRRGSSNVLLRFGKFSELMRMLHRTRGHLKNYVIQQGIRLIEIDGNPLDFRFHLNKNGYNNWVVAGIGAKRAGRGSVTTHVKNGGQIMTPEKALERVYGARSDIILQNAKQAAIRIAEALEKKYNHRLGELGLDIGIDQKDKIWMFEANSKPGRSIFKHPALKSQGKASLQHILEHCIYLSNFRGRSES